MKKFLTFCLVALFSFIVWVEWNTIKDKFKKETDWTKVELTDTNIIILNKVQVPIYAFEKPSGVVNYVTGKLLEQKLDSLYNSNPYLNDPMFVRIKIMGDETMLRVIKIHK